MKRVYKVRMERLVYQYKEALVELETAEASPALAVERAEALLEAKAWGEGLGGVTRPWVASVMVMTGAEPRILAQARDLAVVVARDAFGDDVVANDPALLANAP